MKNKNKWNKINKTKGQTGTISYIICAKEESNSDFKMAATTALNYAVSFCQIL